MDTCYLLSATRLKIRSVHLELDAYHMVFYYGHVSVDAENNDTRHLGKEEC